MLSAHRRLQLPADALEGFFKPNEKQLYCKYGKAVNSTKRVGEIPILESNSFGRHKYLSFTIF